MDPSVVNRTINYSPGLVHLSHHNELELHTVRGLVPACVAAEGVRKVPIMVCPRTEEACAGTSRRLVYKWVKRFLHARVAGLSDLPGRGFRSRTALVGVSYLFHQR